MKAQMTLKFLFFDSYFTPAAFVYILVCNSQIVMVLNESEEDMREQEALEALHSFDGTSKLLILGIKFIRVLLKKFFAVHIIAKRSLAQGRLMKGASYKDTSFENLQNVGILGYFNYLNETQGAYSMKCLQCSLTPDYMKLDEIEDKVYSYHFRNIWVQIFKLDDK